MIKKFGIIVIIYALLCWGLSAHAQTQFSGTLSKIEKTLFGVDYDSQSDDARLKRIEEIVYGQDATGTTQQRVSKLSKDLSADMIGQEIKPKKDSFEDEQDSIKENIPKADSNINYPAVNSLEQKVFSKQFKTMDINQRLANLEQNAFKKTYPNDDLSSRVDRLKSAISPQQLASNSDDDTSSDDYTYIPPSKSTGGASSIGQDDDENYINPSPPISQGYNSDNENYFSPGHNQNNSLAGRGDDPYENYPEDSNITVPLATLEKLVLRRSFPNDNVSNRLTRLETKVFNASFTDDDAQTRLDRLASAYQAKKTSKKYDSNKFAQHMSTAVQVGAILLMILAAVL